MSRWTWHGGGLAAARVYFGEGAEPWIDLSTGINPHAWSGIAEIAIDWRRLPEEGDVQALEAAAAAHFDCDPLHVCAVPGTEIGLRLVGERLTGPTRVRWPSYRTHRDMTLHTRPVATHKLEDADGQTLIIANPNNPDGEILGREALLGLLDRRGDGWLIVDEAFADVDSTPGMAAEVREDRRLIAFRSFGKFFGLAGVRLGFVVGPRAILDDLRGRLGAWPLSAAAIAIGTAAYRDRPWVGTMRKRLHEEAAALDALLARTGLKATGACPLFRLIETTKALHLFERLARRAILTRPFDERPDWLRIGLPEDPHALARLKAALQDG